MSVRLQNVLSVNEFTQQTSVNRINSLHPRLIKPAMDVYLSCIADKIPIHIVWGYRSDEEQATIYKYGRTVPGSLLTTNRPGYSAHNYGLALDFCFYYDGRMQPWHEVEKVKYWRWMWIKVVKRFEQIGWTAGFRWEYHYEPGHVENLLDKAIGDWYIEDHGKIRSHRDKYI